MPSACGGCDGLGAHRRWCPKVVGAYASSEREIDEEIADLRRILANSA